MKTEVVSANDPIAMTRALEVLMAGRLVAFPTDTVYGLGAVVSSAEAVSRLYGAKGRSIEKAIPVLLASVLELPRVALNPPAMALRLAARFWPGPLTMVVTRHPDLPEIVSPLPTVGVRVPDHPVALQLLSDAGPLAVTSANRAGERSPRTAGDVLSELGGRIDLILDGSRTPGGRPSTVVDCTGDELRLLREGPLGLEDLLAALT